MHVFTFIVIGFASTIYKWGNFDYIERENNLLKDQKYPFASKIFDAWDWRVKAPKKAQDIQIQTYRDVMFQVNREKIYQDMENRDTKEKLKLFARRLISFFINMAVFFGGCILIIKTQDAS